MEFTRITYTHHKDVSNISFTDGTASGKSDWTGYFYIPFIPKGNDVKYIEEIAEKNGMEIRKSSIVQEVRTLRFIASAPMIKSFQKIPMFSTVKVKVSSFDEEQVRNMKFSIENWLGGGAYAMCKFTYVVQNYVSKATTRDIV